MLMGLALVGAACTSGGGNQTAQSTQPAQQSSGNSSSSDTKKPEGTTPRDADSEKPTETKRNKDAKPYTETLKLSLDDIQDYWSEQMPEIYGQEYEPIPDSKIYAATSKKPAPSCSPKGGQGTYEEIHNNAFYCTLGSYVAFDDQDLMPRLYETYGEFALAMVFAHEWGHAVQHQIGAWGTVPTIVSENQADCFAGAWTKHALDNKTGGFRATPGDLQSALAGMLEFRDKPGTSIEDKNAHGSGFDRVNGFQSGFEGGAETCATFLKSPPNFLDLKFGSAEDKASGGNLPYEKATELAAIDLNAYWENIGKTYKVSFEPVDNIERFSSETSMPTCGSETYSEADALGTIFFCFDENKVAWDEDMMRDVSTSIGDYGVAILLAKQWAASFQLQGGQDKDHVKSKLGVTQQSCFTGAWTRAVLDGDKHNLQTGEDGEPTAFLTLSPGDLDEAIKAFLAFSDTPDSKGDTASGSAFENVKAFRDGFLAENGEVVCDSYGTESPDETSTKKQ